MLAALEGLRGEHEFEIAVVDVDSDPELEARYDELVPVLVANGAELCHFFFDETAVSRYLRGACSSA
ncbi:MAG: glutaredoxin family protein [Rhodocyclaceae bacterium]|nr:glutaredoxin family protein [Rhodocyclaceae bacterium]